MAEAMSGEEIDRHIRALDESRDSSQLSASALALASSEDDRAIAALADHLARGEFLDRLDDTSNPGLSTVHLRTVFRSLADHPTSATARLCERLYAEPDFRSEPIRINFLLHALAAVRPVSEASAEVFRAAHREGYASVSGPALVSNESPLALRVFEETVTGTVLDPPTIVDLLHSGLLPNRTRLAVLESCSRLLAGDLDPDVRLGLVETLFDHKSRKWFGPVMSPPLPPAWDSAPDESLEFLVGLAQRVLASRDLDADRARAVRDTVAEIEEILESRRR